MIFGIIRDGVRSAFVRIVRYIVFAIIALLIFYIIGIFTNKKVNALAIKGSTQIQYSNNHDRETQIINPSSSSTFTTSTSIEFALSSPLTTNYDLVGFNMARFGIHGTTGNNASNSFCSFTYLTNQLSYSECTGSQLERIISEFSGGGEYYHVYGFVRYSDGTQGTCYRSTEYENYIMCPTNASSITSFVWRMNTALANDFNTLTFHVTMNDEVLLFNYESTEIINSNGVIIQQQQQTQQTITDSTTTTSQANATSSLNTISGQFNDVLNGWGGQWSSLTHVVLEPINTVLYAFDSGTTCTPITLTIPYLNDGQTITLPCMSSIYGTYFSGFITVFAMIIGGLYGYRTVMYILRTIKDVIDAENDKIEVIDL